MLIWQAALAFKLWTARQAPIDVMRRAAEQALEAG
jgi:shikimate 5-dehydrogenase